MSWWRGRGAASERQSNAMANGDDAHQRDGHQREGRVQEPPPRLPALQLASPGGAAVRLAQGVHLAGVAFWARGPGRPIAGGCGPPGRARPAGHELLQQAGGQRNWWTGGAGRRQRRGQGQPACPASVASVKHAPLRAYLSSSPSPWDCASLRDTATDSALRWACTPGAGLLNPAAEPPASPPASSSSWAGNGGREGRAHTHTLTGRSLCLQVPCC